MATALPPSPSPSGSIDIGRIFGFVIEDPEWVKKVLIGAAFTLASSFIIGIFFVMGYWVRLVRNVAAGVARPLPTWDDLGGIFKDGLTAAGVAFVHAFGILFVLGAIGCAGGMMIAGLSGGGGRRNPADEILAAMGGLGIAGLYLALIVLMLLLQLYLPAALTRVALRGDFATGFDWRANFEFIKANVANYLLSVVFYFVASFAAQFGVILCCVGVFPLAFWAYLVLGYGLGETVRLSPRPV
jgi:hypothetical protein